MNFNFLNNEIRFINSNIRIKDKKPEQEADKKWLWIYLHNRKRSTATTAEQKVCPKCNILLPLSGLCDQCD